MSKDRILPTATPIHAALTDISSRIPYLVAEVLAAEWNGPIGLARAFVVLKILKDKVEETFKPFDEIYNRTKTELIPQKFEELGIPNVTLDEGYRIGVSHQVRAGVRAGRRDDAMTWLREQGLGDIISETINASTLGAVAKTLAEENRELDPDIFNVAILPTTSVNTVPKKNQ